MFDIKSDRKETTNKNYGGSSWKVIFARFLQKYILGRLFFSVDYCDLLKILRFKGYKASLFVKSTSW